MILRKKVPEVHRSTEMCRNRRINEVELHERDKEKDRTRKRIAREKVKLDQSREGRMKIKNEREKSAARVKKHRELKKANVVTKTSADTNDNMPKQSCREYQKLYKRKQRANTSRQKHQALKLQDKERKRRGDNLD